MKDSDSIIIIGGGLSGLTLAYLLSQRSIKTTVLEASDRLGGRIQTVKGVLETPLELGATWFSTMHTNMICFLDELGLHKYPQFSEGISLFQTKSFEPPQKFFVPQAQTPSYRLVGGTLMLIDTLTAKLPHGTISLNTKVTGVKNSETCILVETDGGKTFCADKVVICIPPQLTSHISFLPSLPSALSDLLPTVQTWMAASIKFTLEYDQPFWRHQGYSGMLYSHAGIIAEMYDHTNFEENKFGFTGFLNGIASSYPQHTRKELVLQQLRDLLGVHASDPTAYIDKVWTDSFVFGGSQVVQFPHQNNGHKLLQQSYMNDRLFFAGTEVSTEFPGYMEGAIFSAKSIADRLAHL